VTLSEPRPTTATIQTHVVYIIKDYLTLCCKIIVLKFKVMNTVTAGFQSFHYFHTCSNVPPLHKHTTVQCHCCSPIQVLTYLIVTCLTGKFVPMGKLSCTSQLIRVPTLFRADKSSGPLHSPALTIETVWKSITKWRKRLNAVRSRMEALFSTFSTNRCDLISISCREMCWTYWLFCTLRTPNTLLHMLLSNKGV